MCVPVRTLAHVLNGATAVQADRECRVQPCVCVSMVASEKGKIYGLLMGLLDNGIRIYTSFHLFAVHCGGTQDTLKWCFANWIGRWQGRARPLISQTPNCFLFAFMARAGADDTPMVMIMIGIWINGMWKLFYSARRKYVFIDTQMGWVCVWCFMRLFLMGCWRRSSVA